MSNLVRHAEDELARAGWLDDEGMYGDMIGKAVLELIEKFAEQGHSGMSAGVTVRMFERVAMFKPLSPITSAPQEWIEVGPSVWQNRRQSSCFSNDGGKTYHDIDKDQRGWMWKIPSLIRRRIPQPLWGRLIYRNHKTANPEEK